MKHIDYNENPFIVIWEVTRACALSCVHCRAEAQFHRYENELETEEGKALIREIHAMDNPILVFTGGDPLMREDLFELTAYASFPWDARLDDTFSHTSCHPRCREKGESG